MKSFIYQINENECGYASLKMLLASLYKDKRFLFLPHEDKSNHQYSLLELKDVAKKYGVILGGYIIKSKKEMLINNKPFILIIHKDDKKHAVLVKRTNKRFSYVYDPALGKRLISNRKLYEDISNGFEVLIVESFTRQKLSFDLPNFVNKKDAIFLGVIECLAIASYFISAFYISPKSYITLPIIFIVVGAILSILYHLFSYNIMQRFDDTFIKYTYDNIPSVRRDNYILMHKTKSGVFSTTYRFLLNLISALAVNTILVLNNNYLFYIPVTTLLIVIIDYFFITPIIKNNVYEVEKMEEKLLDSNIEQKQYENDYTKIKENSYKVAKQIDVKKVISIFLILMITFFVSGMRSEANVYFILFNFAICLFTYTSFYEAIKCIENYKEDTINKVKFYDLIIK